MYYVLNRTLLAMKVRRISILCNVSLARPCSRCVKRGLEAACVDMETGKKRGKKPSWIKNRVSPTGNQRQQIQHSLLLAEDTLTLR